MSMPKPEVMAIPEFCSHCKERLARKPWNTAVDILFCENSSCIRCYQPQGNIPMPPRSMKEVIALLEKEAQQRIKVRDAARGPGTATIKERRRKK